MVVVVKCNQVPLKISRISPVLTTITITNQRARLPVTGQLNEAQRRNNYKNTMWTAAATRQKKIFTRHDRLSMTLCGSSWRRGCLAKWGQAQPTSRAVELCYRNRHQTIPAARRTSTSTRHKKSAKPGGLVGREGSHRSRRRRSTESTAPATRLRTRAWAYPSVSVYSPLFMPQS